MYIIFVLYTLSSQLRSHFIADMWLCGGEYPKDQMKSWITRSQFVTSIIAYFNYKKNFGLLKFEFWSKQIIYI